MNIFLKVSFYSFIFVSLAPQIKDLGIPRLPSTYRDTYENNEIKRSQKIPFIGMIIMLIAVLTISKLSNNRKDNGVAV